MGFLLLLTISLVELATTVGKWLFIVSAPVLLIVAGSYYQAGKSSFESLVGLTLVAGVFVVTRLLSEKLSNTGHFWRGSEPKTHETKVDPRCEDLEIWKQFFEGEHRQHTRTKYASDRTDQRYLELWNQTHPWGGYNPYE